MSKRTEREVKSGKDFVHLHVHTEYSALDGMGKVKDYVSRAVQLRQPALSITDHGYDSGHPEHYFECKKQGIEPILGCEFYIVEDHAHRPDGGKQPERFHVTVLGRGLDGYRVLTELSTLSHHQYHYKPVLDRANLEALGDAAQHLTVLSGCASSLLSHAVLSGDDDRARTELYWWRETFPNFYIELMHHDTDFDKKLNRSLIKLAKKHRVPWVVTNDPHYVNKDEHEVHDALLAIQVAKPIDDPDRFRFDGDGYHLRSRKEMRAALEGNYGADVWRPGVANTLSVAKDCYTDIPAWNKRVWQVPKFPDAEDSDAYVKKVTRKRLKDLGKWDDPEYREQWLREFKAAKKGGINDFMLITRESIVWAKENGIPVGPGRGSVAGSLLAFLLDIHKVDPIKYKLLFERFYNPARPRMPDIDTDFGQLRRPEVFKHVEDKYGLDNVLHVATFQRMKAKKTFGGLAKAFGYSYQDRMRLSKEIVSDDDPDSADITYILPDEVLRRTPELLPIMDQLVGLKTGVSRHPAGVLIADPKQRIRTQVPEMYIPSSKTYAGQYDLDQVEHLGLMKQDFLGLRTLDTIQKTVQWVAERHGDVFDPDDWDPDNEEDDDKVYKMLAKGHTAGVFQMEGPTNTRGCKDVKPKSFEDLVSITALYRTGAIRAGFPKIFNENRQGRLEDVPYLHPLLRPILEQSWGVVIYQEQVMEMAKVIAGFDMVQVDDIKEAIKHKKGALMQELRPLFIKGAKKTNGIDRDLAGQIYSMIEGYSGYGYNRSHAVAYTLTTYQTARLKYLYPTEYLAALLATIPNDKDNEEKRSVYLREAVSLGVKILPPCVNRSAATTSPDGMGDGIRFGLSDLSGIGVKTADKIVAGRPRRGYKKPHHVRRVVQNDASMRSLADGSAMECVGVEGDEHLTEKLLKWQFKDRMAKWRKKYRHEIRLPDDDSSGEECTIVGQIVKVTFGKTKEGPKDADGKPKWQSKPYVTWTIRYDTVNQWDLRMWNTCSEHWDAGVGSIVLVTGEWDSKWLNISTAKPEHITIIKKVEASAP